MKHYFALLVCFTVILSACSPNAPAPTTMPSTAVPPTATATPLPPTPMPELTETPSEMTGMISAVESWEGVPVIPGATSGMAEMRDYIYTTAANEEEITDFYEQAMPELGWQSREDKTKRAPGTAFTCFKDGTFVFFKIQSIDGRQNVFMHFVDE